MQKEQIVRNNSDSETVAVNAAATVAADAAILVDGEDLHWNVDGRCRWCWQLSILDWDAMRCLRKAGILTHGCEYDVCGVDDRRKGEKIKGVEMKDSRCCLLNNVDDEKSEKHFGAAVTESDRQTDRQQQLIAPVGPLVSNLCLSHGIHPSQLSSSF